VHAAVRPHLGSHLDGEQTRARADVHDLLAGAQREDPPHVVALPGDVRGDVDGFEPAGADLVERQHPGHCDLLGAGRRAQHPAVRERGGSEIAELAEAVAPVLTGSRREPGPAPTFTSFAHTSGRCAEAARCFVTARRRRPQLSLTPPSPQDRRFGASRVDLSLLPDRAARHPGRRHHDLQYRLSMVAPTTIRARYRQVSAAIKG
jgi:hypothetical protein